MSFSCPHFDPDGDLCRLLKTDCVPGRRGCVLGSKAVFAVPVEERIRAREEENRQRALARWIATPERHASPHASRIAPQALGNVTSPPPRMVPAPSRGDHPR